MYKKRFYINQLLKSKALIIVFTFLHIITAKAQIVEKALANENGELFPSDTYAQIVDRKLDLTKDLKSQLQPLDSLIAIAQNYSPTVKSQDALIHAGEAQVRLGRREWQNGVFLSFNQSMGNQSLFYDSNQDAVGTQSQSISTGYRLALNVNIPLYWFSARNAKIDIARNELMVRAETKNKMRLDVAKEVIYEYNNLISTHHILLIASNSKGTSKVLTDMAEKQFAQGDITIADYSGILAIATKAESDYEIAKRDFYSWYLQLENLLGQRLDNLVRK